MTMAQAIGPKIRYSDKCRRVVITGMGIVTPIGNNVKDAWKAILEGNSGIGYITLFDAKDAPVKIAGEVKDFDPSRIVKTCYPRGVGSEAITQAVHPRHVRRMGRFILMAMSAGLEAYIDSGIDALRDKIPAERIGTNIGVGMGGLPEIEETHSELLAKGYKRVTPYFIPQIIPNMASGQLGLLINSKGPNMSHTSACASGSHSIGESFRQIQRGDADIIFTGGAESVICSVGIGGFAAIKALSTKHNDSPTKASRPFDIDRDGFVMSEGAAVLALEEYEHAKKRGANIIAEICGYGFSSDAYHMTKPAPEGEGGQRAMQMALKDASINPDEVGYVNAHATATLSGDIEEVGAIARVFPNGKEHLHISSTKSTTGHLLSSAGAIEAIFSALSLKEGYIPPTTNLDNVDPECAKYGISLTPNVAVEKQLKYALSNSLGFGGTNASIILGKI